ncbi:MAG: hypothetical protein ACLQVI_24305 [Polyangiaceae bacterium]|jgi:hypothetical protein
MQVLGGQFIRGPMPSGSTSGPAVDKILLVNADIWPGRNNFPIGGDLGTTATAAALGLRGDVGYWVVPAGVPNYLTPTLPSVNATAEFALGIVPGTYTLVYEAIDDKGTYGLPSSTILYEEPSPLNPPATGALVVTLTWDTESNLSLHVVDPAAQEIYWGAQSTAPPLSFQDVDGGSYGYIDYDSNANCVIDGLRREDAIWPDPPPPGQYTVRVDTPSLCGQAEANWTVKVVLEGKQIADVTGIALPPDTWGSHGIGSGVLALQFTVP